MDMEFSDFRPHQNTTNGTETLDGSEFFHQNLSWTLPYAIIMVIGTVVGIIGNTMVMVAIVTYKKLKRIENALFFNLAVADMVITGFVDLFFIAGVIKGETVAIDNPILCLVVAELCLTSCFCSCLTIAAATFNRFIHICHRELYPKIFSKRNTILLILFLWIFSYALTVPHYFGWGGHWFDPKVRACNWNRTADFGYTLVFAITLFVALFIIAGGSFRLYRYLVDKRHMINTFSPLVIGSDCADKEEQERHRKEYADSVMYAKTVFIIFATYTICWVPYAIIVAADRYDEWPFQIHLYAAMMAHTNSCLNCVIYPLAHRYFKEAYKAMFSKVFPCVSCFKSPASIELVDIADEPEGKDLLAKH